jgi:hypothetical protein
MSYVDACAELGIETGSTISHESTLFYDEAPPSAKWQEMANLVIKSAENYLWNKAPAALEYLMKRGFTEETIRRARLGYVPLMSDGKWYQRSFSDWGLTDDMLSEKQKAKGNVKIPPGILIPWICDQQTWKLAIKRFEAKDGEMSYGQTVGSRDAMYNADSLARGKHALLVEGEFDVLSAQQTCGDIISPIGTGSTAKARIPLWIARMSSLADVVLLGFDNDENGAGDTAASFWLDTLPNAMRWTPWSHDCNQMLQEKIDIRQWVEMGINLATMPNTLPTTTDTTSTQQDALSPSDEEIDGIDNQQEPLICCVCGMDLNNVEINAYIDPEDIEKAYCENDWNLWELSHYQNVEEFAQYVGALGVSVMGDCTVTIIPPDYTHEQRVAQLLQEEKNAERAKWMSFGKNKAS